jgi:hypothetical protein
VLKLSIGVALLLVVAPAAFAAPELSISERLQERRYRTKVDMGSVGVRELSSDTRLRGARGSNP